MPFEPAQFPLQQHLDMDVDSPGEGRGRATLTVTEDLLNPNGVVHGAVVFAMVDTSMGAAAMSVLDDEHFCASIEVHVRFFRPVASGQLVVETDVVKGGRRIIQLDSRVHDGDNALIAAASGSFAVINRPDL